MNWVTPNEEKRVSNWEDNGTETVIIGSCSLNSMHWLAILNIKKGTKVKHCSMAD